MNRATWRAVAPLLEAQTNAFRVELARHTVSIEPLLEEEGGKEEKEKGHDLWKGIEHSGILTLHVAGAFPNLAMTLWALKR